MQAKTLLNTHIMSVSLGALRIYGNVGLEVSLWDFSRPEEHGRVKTVTSHEHIRQARPTEALVSSERDLLMRQFCVSEVCFQKLSWST